MSCTPVIIASAYIARLGYSLSLRAYSNTTGTLTLDALGLSLADTHAAMEADSEVGALTMQSLGLTMEDLREGELVDAPEDIAERLARILETFGSQVQATSDLVVVEPEESFIRPHDDVQHTMETANVAADSTETQAAETLVPTADSEAAITTLDDLGLDLSELGLGIDDSVLDVAAQLARDD